VTSSLKSIAGPVFIWQRINHVIFLLRNILLALYILPGDLGSFTAGLNLAGYIAILSSFDFRTAFFSRKDLNEKEINTQWTMEVVLGCVTLLAGLALFPWIMEQRSSPIALCMIGLVVVTLMEASFSTHLYLLEKDLQFGYLSAVRTWINGSTFLVTLVLAWLGFGWVALLIDRVLSATVTGLVVVLKSGWRPRLIFDRTSIKWYGGFLGILFLNGLFLKIVYSFDVFAIAKRLGPAETGVYAMAMKWALIPMEIGANFLAVFALSYYAKQSHAGLEAFRRGYEEISFHILRFCLLIAVLMVLFMEDFFRIFYRDIWQGVPPVFHALLLYAVARPLFQNSCQAFQARKFLWPLFFILFLQALIGVPVLWEAASRGLIAVSIALGLVVLVGFLLGEIYLHRQLKHEGLQANLLPIVLSLFVLGIWWFYLRNLDDPMALIAKILLGIVYGVVAWLEWNRMKQKFDHPPA
jgi:O-antigen/teichoic acid export membrane protein